MSAIRIRTHGSARSPWRVPWESIALRGDPSSPATTDTLSVRLHPCRHHQGILYWEAGTSRADDILLSGSMRMVIEAVKH